MTKKQFIVAWVVGIFLLAGCASVSERFRITEEQGKERIFSYPYNKVFYACEDALAHGNYPVYNSRLRESDIKKGQIWGNLEFPMEYVYINIIVRKTDEIKTSVKIKEFGVVTQSFYVQFFSDVERIASRNE
jgi:hypothetical protein